MVVNVVSAIYYDSGDLQQANESGRDVFWVIASGVWTILLYDENKGMEIDLARQMA